MAATQNQQDKLTVIEHKEENETAGGQSEFSGLVMPDDLTKSQWTTLQVAINDGGIIFVGMDRTLGVRRDVVRKLGKKGYLKLVAPASFFIEQQWALTDKARALKA